MTDSEGKGLFIGMAKLKKTKSKVGDKFCSGLTSPSPRHVKECLLLTLRLRLMHPADMNTTSLNVRDTLMQTIHGNKENVKVNKSNEVSRYNNKIVEVVFEGVAAAFFFDFYGPITKAGSVWLSGTTEVVQRQLRHNQDVLIEFCKKHDPVGAEWCFPHGNYLLRILYFYEFTILTNSPFSALQKVTHAAKL